VGLGDDDGGELGDYYAQAAYGIAFLLFIWLKRGREEKRSPAGQLPVGAGGHDSVGWR